MTIKLIHITFLLGLSTGIAAQKDSLTLRSVNGLQEQNLYEIYKKQAAGMILNPVQHYGIANIYYHHAEGEYRRVQEAGKSAVAGFSSEGLKKVDNFWVQGSFTYQREWDDSVHKSLRRDPNDRSPYYLWTPRTGDMNHEVYHLDGQFTALIGKKLLLGAGAVYDASDSYRTIDPRPFVNYFNFDVKASIGYRLNDKNLLVIEPHSGYGKESTSAYSKNNDSTTAAAYQVYRAEGLAEISSASESKRQLSQWRNYNGISVGYYLSNATIGNWYAGYSYTDTREKSFNRFYNPTTELEYGKVNYYDHQAQLSWHHKYTHWLATLSWLMDLNKSKDYNTYLSGVNYTSWQNSNTVSAGMSLYKTQRPVHEFWLAYTHAGNEQKDGNNDARANYISNRYQFQYRLHLYQKFSQIQVTLNGAIKKNGSSSLTIPANAFDYLFIPSVLYPDAAYFTTDNWQTGIKFSYNSSHATKLRWGIELGSQFVKNSKTGLYFSQGYSQPGSDRVYWNTAIHFFL